MDSFMEPLYSHLKAEPSETVALPKHNAPEKPIDILGIADVAGTCKFLNALCLLGSDFNEDCLILGKKQVNLSFMFNTLPVFFLNVETVEFEGGMWRGVFPRLKGLARTVMNKAVPMWQSGRWRFVSCDADGRVKDLAV